jgi:hypothetical protein
MISQSKEHRQKPFENRALRRIFKKKISSQKSVSVIISGRMKFTGKSLVDNQKASWV